MNMTRLMIASAALLASSAVLAADEKPKFEAADANGDGMVDASEFAATGIERDFGELDADGNGSLNGDEYAAALEEDCA